jgi:hypothetical protein
MSPSHRRLATLGILLASLAACGGGGSALAGIESLGVVFQQAFGQGTNDMAVDVTNAGLSLDVTAEPFAL